MFLLWHHLFYIQNGKYTDYSIIDGYMIINQLGIACKVCVALFVFLSGYGLAKKNQTGSLDAYNFYIGRYTKLMLNYWLIWLLFVPIGISFWGRTPEIVYQDHIIAKLIIDFLGMSYSFGFYGFNPTWWFMSCIILLYLLFPFLYKYRRYCLAFIVFSILIVWIPLYVFNPIKYYLTAFVLGIYCSQSRLFVNVISLDSMLAKLIFLILCIFLFFVRNFFPYPLLFDSILTIVIIVTYKVLNSNGLFYKICCFIGKYSMNIFLFHTFIYYYYFSNIIYCSSNPVFIFFILLGVSLFIALIIEKIKQFLCFDEMSQKIISCLSRRKK